jgi:SAM-dependent methyltransferase
VITPAEVRDGPATEPAEFRIEDADIPEFRVALTEIARSGYREAGIRDRLGLADLADIQWKALPIYRDVHLANRDAQAVALDLFLLQGSIPEAELDLLLTAPSRDVLLRTGFLSIDSGVARARASLYPVGDRLIFSDHAWHKLPHPGYRQVPSDQVMFVGTDSRWLARATVRRRVRRTLDLCTGSGIHALLAAAHSERVLAVDINRRAALCARCNAQIAGAQNLEVLLGDVFEAVSPAEHFDLILANPPFVPSPVEEMRFRDGGPSGEEVQRRIVAGLPRHLAPGGIAQLVTEVGERDGEPIVQRIRQWLDGAPMDIHVLQLRVHTAESYAIGHASGDGDFGAYLDSVRAWAGNLRAQGYVRLISILVAFQWSDAALGAPWDRVDECQPLRGEAGPEIESAFAWERAARKHAVSGMPDDILVSRAGPIALTESEVLGRRIHAPARATLLGRALVIEHALNPLETRILRRLDEPIVVSQLLRMSSEWGLEEGLVASSIDSLRRRGLIQTASM